MMNRRVIPSLLLQGSGFYRTLKFKNPSYVGDPINTIRIFNDKEVDELMILDITASKQNSAPNFEVLEEIASESFVPMSYGGGLSQFEDIEKIFRLGYEKVALGQATLTDPDLVRKASEHYGAQSVVGIVNVSKGLFGGKYGLYDYINKKRRKEPLDSWCHHLQELGVGEILLHFADREGTGSGYDNTLIESLSNELDIPLICLGGAKNEQDFKLAFQKGADAVAAGNFFVYHGPHKAVLISYPTRQEILEIIHS